MYQDYFDTEQHSESASNKATILKRLHNIENEDSDLESQVDSVLDENNLNVRIEDIKKKSMFLEPFMPSAFKRESDASENDSEEGNRGKFKSTRDTIFGVS
jgi:hypothetical protein